MATPIEILKQYNPKSKLADIPAEEGVFWDAIGEILPDFEYPDISHLTVEHFIKKAERKEQA